MVESDLYLKPVWPVWAERHTPVSIPGSSVMGLGLCECLYQCADASAILFLY